MSKYHTLPDRPESAGDNDAVSIEEASYSDDNTIESQSVIPPDQPGSAGYNVTAPIEISSKLENTSYITLESEFLIAPAKPGNAGYGDTSSIRETFDVESDNPTSAARHQNLKAGLQLLWSKKDTIIMWAPFVVLLALVPMTAAVWSRGNQVDYGIGVLRESTDCGVAGTFFMTFITLCLNIIASSVVYASGYIRAKTGPHWSLWILLVLFSIPAPFLSNSLIFQSISAHDAYEVLASDTYLRQGSPFNLGSLQLRPTIGNDDSLQQDYNMKPPKLDSLTDSLMLLQKSIALNNMHTGWQNLSFNTCIQRYKSGTYSTFSTVLIITNWTASSDSNNSALGLTILSGESGPKYQSRQSLVALCPQSFFSTFNITEPQKWNYAAKGTVGLCDSYSPKAFNVTTHNVFVKYCLSQEVKQTCRLLYSPLSLKIACVCLTVAVACMALLLFSRLGSWKSEPDDHSQFHGVYFIIASGVVVVVAFIIQLSLTASTSVTLQRPKDKSDQAWLLNAFCIINVVQLVEAICEAFVVPWGTALGYTIFSTIWHFFVGITFSMQLNDRYMITSSPPGSNFVPYADLSSLWFKSLFKFLFEAAFIHDDDKLDGFINFILILVIFAIPLVGRAALSMILLK